MNLKKYKILSVVILCITILSSIFMNAYVNTYNFNKGDTIGYTRYTDVKTFINNNEIQSYGINDYIFVAVEDLAEYYFIIEWNSDKSELHFSRDMDYTEKEVDFTPDPNKGKIGSPYLPILFTDVKVYYEGYFLRSFDVDGKLVIYLDDLAAFTGGDYAWNEITKTLTLETVPYYYIDPIYTWKYNTGDTYTDEKVTAIDKSFMYKFSNKTEDDGDILFNIVRHTGDYGGISDIVISGTYVSFSVSDEVDMSGKFWEDIFEGVNVENGKRLEDDTHERRIELYYSFKIYINDKVAGGELLMKESDGKTIFTFNMDVAYAIEDVETVQIEIG